MNQNLLIAAEIFHYLGVVKAGAKPFELFLCIWDSTKMAEDLVAQRYLHIRLDEDMVWLGNVITQEDQTNELLLVTGLQCGVHSHKGSSRIGNGQLRSIHKQCLVKPLHGERASPMYFTHGFLLRRHIFM